MEVSQDAEGAANTAGCKGDRCKLKVKFEEKGHLHRPCREKCRDFEGCDSSDDGRGWNFAGRETIEIEGIRRGHHHHHHRHHHHRHHDHRHCHPYDRWCGNFY